MSQDNTPINPNVDVIESVPPPPVVGGQPDYFTSRIVGVKFRKVGKVYDFDARDFKFTRGDRVVCDFEDKGMMLGEVSKPTILIPPDVLKLKLQPILRPANHNDIKNRERQETLEKEALIYTKNLVESTRLAMHII